jgi:hypothetical protein
VRLATSFSLITTPTKSLHALASEKCQIASDQLTGAEQELHAGSSI